MGKKVALIIAVVLAVYSFASLQADDKASKPNLRSSPPSDQLGFELTVSPAPDTPGSYVCETIITDLASGEVRSRRSTTIASGTEMTFMAGTQSSPDPTSGTELIVNMLIDDKQSNATYTAKYSRGGTLVLTQKACVTIGMKDSK
jgi:hypothetical protein